MTDQEFEKFFNGIVTKEKNLTEDESALITETDIDELLTEIKAMCGNNPGEDTAVLSEPILQKEDAAEDIFYPPILNQSFVTDDEEKERKTEFGFTEYLYSGRNESDANTHEPAENKPRKKNFISSILFYFAVAVAVLTAFVFSVKDGSPRNIFGYSYFTVLSGSMQREIPKGSLVITKHTDPNTIQIGDDITYIKSDTTTVTHRVVEIYENYEDSGVRGFRTKGLENPAADPAIVHAASVVGVVKFHTAGVGAFLSYIAENLWMVVGLFAVFIALSFTLRIFLGEVKKGKPPKNQKSAQEVPGTS